jgi:hypothetical protein
VEMQQLTRVDVQVVKPDESYDQEVIFAHKEDIDLLRKIFEQIKWQQNVKAEMDRKEDAKATLFFEIDKNMPERLVEYFIWFNQGDETSTIIDRDKHAYGTLDNENTKMLKVLLVNQ